ncbi:MAG: guanylate kinase [Roseburia sp.]
MGYIFCIMGKSATGKDTIYKMLSEQEKLSCSPIVLYTTRPIRAGETEGVEYHYVSDARLDELERQGRVIEVRSYQTVYGIWRYATVDDGQIDLSARSYLMIGTLDVYTKLCAYYGRDRIVPIYIEVEDGLRLQRALDRERMQDPPKYAEMCRRFLADTEDFSEEKLAEAGITHRFVNLELGQTVEQITDFIQNGYVNR